jgi:four helix bundle protein
MKPDTDNPIIAKSFAFALRIIKLHRYLVEVKKEYTLSKELLIAGTHIGKHAKEAVHGESRERFALEMGAALRKANETEYWLQLVHFGGYIDEKEFLSIDTDRTELAKMLTSITKTTRDNG